MSSARDRAAFSRRGFLTGLAALGGAAVLPRIASSAQGTSTAAAGAMRINTHARPIALQIALLIPLIAALIGIVLGFRMTRLPDIEPSASAETLLAG